MSLVPLQSPSPRTPYVSVFSQAYADLARQWTTAKALHAPRPELRPTSPMELVAQQARFWGVPARLIMGTPPWQVKYSSSTLRASAALKTVGMIAASFAPPGLSEFAEHVIDPNYTRLLASIDKETSEFLSLRGRQATWGAMLDWQMNEGRAIGKALPPELRPLWSEVIKELWQIVEAKLGVTR